MRVRTHNAREPDAPMPVTVEDLLMVFGERTTADILTQLADGKHDDRIFEVPASPVGPFVPVTLVLDYVIDERSLDEPELPLEGALMDARSDSSES